MRIWTKVLMGERWRLCSSPIPDLSLAKRVLMLDRFLSRSLSSRGRCFFMVRRIPASRCSTRCHRRFIGNLAMGPLSPNTLPRRAAAMSSNGWRSPDIAPCDLHGHDLALVVDGQVELEARHQNKGRQHSTWLSGDRGLSPPSVERRTTSPLTGTDHPAAGSRLDHCPLAGWGCPQPVLAQRLPWGRWQSC